MFRKAVFILSGNAFGSLMLLIRNLAVARLVSVEDYGIASTFAISMAIVEMASGLGLQQLIVQDKDGENPDLQAGLQGFNVIRSLFSALVMFLLAHPIARFLGVPDIAWAYQILALIPLLRGFEHFDTHRLSRSMRFGPLILTKTVPAALSVLSVWPLYLVYGDFQVMLYSVLLHCVLGLIMGHLMAERRYQVNFHRSFMRKGLNFGWPLLVNNALLFLVFQGDRLIVGRELGMETLAVFSMGITFTLTPTLVSGVSEQQYFLPQLSAVREDRDRFLPLALAAMQTSLVIGMGLVLVITALAYPLVYLLLGSKYDSLIPLLPWLAVWQAIRTFKVGNTFVAMAQGQTTNAMIANAVRVLALPLAYFMLHLGGSLLHIILIALVAEVCGYLISLALVVRRVRIPIAPMRWPLILALLALSFTGMEVTFLEGSWRQMFLGWSVACAVSLASFCTMQPLRRYIQSRGVHVLQKSEG